MKYPRPLETHFTFMFIQCTFNRFKYYTYQCLIFYKLNNEDFYLSDFGSFYEFSNSGILKNLLVIPK